MTRGDSHTRWTAEIVGACLSMRSKKDRILILVKSIEGLTSNVPWPMMFPDISVFYHFGRFHEVTTIQGAIRPKRAAGMKCDSEYMLLELLVRSQPTVALHSEATFRRAIH